MNRVGIEMLTVLGMPPVEYVRLAAELGCVSVSTGLACLPLAMLGVTDFTLHEEWSLRDDPALRREMMAAMRDTGVKIGLAEGFMAQSGADVRDYAADLDLIAELGALRLNAICLEDAMVTGSTAAKDQLAILAGMAAERGIVFTIEFFPHTGITSLDKALDIVEHIGRGKAHVLLDTMHLFRTGGTVEQVAALDPELIGYVQLCDARLAPPDDSYMAEAMFARGVPGQGELPLRELIAVLPKDVVISLEVPRLDDLRAGMTPGEHAARVVAAARALGA